MAYNLIPRETQVSKITTTGKTTLEGAATGYIPFAAVGDLTGDDLPEVVISGWSFVDQLSFYETPNIDFVIVSQRQDEVGVTSPRASPTYHWCKASAPLKSLTSTWME